MTSFITLHASQVQEIANTIPDPAPVARAAGPDARAHALRVMKEHKIEAKAYTLRELNAELDKVQFQNINRRMTAKAAIAAGGFLLEPAAVDKRAVVMAGLMSEKSGIPLPEGKPYTVAQFDELAAAADLGVGHRLEIKQQFLKVGLICDGDRPAMAQQQPIRAAAEICSALGLDAGKKHSVPDVDAAMEKRGWNMDRRVHGKTVLAGAGLI
jgi:hypothetical protein